MIKTITITLVVVFVYRKVCEKKKKARLKDILKSIDEFELLLKLGIKPTQGIQMSFSYLVSNDLSNSLHTLYSECYKLKNDYIKAALYILYDQSLHPISVANLIEELNGIEYLKTNNIELEISSKLTALAVLSGLLLLSILMMITSYFIIMIGGI